ncbi:hypothetical protein ACWDO6_10360 [Streptomyces sp. NPDC003674]|uniref:hypothetical protein n=1 Tax=Streptomyces sp. NPDC015684 TaxID=3364963 RepID=UPI0036FE3C7F
MPEIHIIDTHALLALPGHCADERRIHLFFDELTSHVASGFLTFPGLVVNDCREYAQGEISYTWIKAVSAHRRYQSVDNGWLEEVLTRCEDLADLDDDQEQTPLLVGAMGLMLEDIGLDVSIVTEDRLELPNRMCLSEACVTLSLEAMDAREFLMKCGMDDFL